jgi:hypothetical protein
MFWMERIAIAETTIAATAYGNCRLAKRLTAGLTARGTVVF